MTVHDIQTTFSSISLPAVFLISVTFFMVIYWSFTTIAMQVAKWAGPAKTVMTRPPGKGQIRREIKSSMVSIGIFGIYAVLTVVAHRSGLIEIIFTPGFKTVLFELAALFLWNEAHFYACHWLLHRPSMMRRFHSVHHSSIVATPYTTFSFHWVEAAMLGSVMILYTFILPISVFGIVYLPILSLAVNIAGHWNLSLPPFAKATIRHAEHHRSARVNFGFLLPVFDNLFGTAAKPDASSETKPALRWPQVIAVRNKYLMGGVWLTAALFLYLGINHFSSGHSEIPSSWLDRAIPFMPDTIWIYLSYFFIYIVAFVLEKDTEYLNRYMWAVLIINLSSSVVFLVYPTYLPRDLVVFGDEVSALTISAYNALHGIDRPNNCLPSLHVSASYMAAFLWWRRRPVLFWFLFVWATAIAISTMTTKQHYFLDVVTGTALALLTYRLCFHLRQEGIQATASPQVAFSSSAAADHAAFQSKDRAASDDVRPGA